MGKSIYRPALMIAALLFAAAPRAALAWDGHGYPPVVHSETYERSSSQSWSSDSGWTEGQAWSDDQSAAAGGYRERGRYYEDHWVDRGLVADNSVGYLPLSFFGDAGGVGPFPVDYGYSGGGYGYVVGGGSAFAGAHASAHVSANISIAFHGRGGGGYHHGGGGHGCGCK